MKYYTVVFKISPLSEDKPLTDTTLETAWDLVTALAGETGFESFSDISEGFIGYVRQDCFDAETLQHTLRDFPLPGVSVTFTANETEDRDWNEAWERDGFQPIVIDDQCVIHDLRHKPDSVAPDTIDITIDARQAFGTGTHETTRMMVRQLLAIPLQGKRVLDCGCGTGILGIVASKRGANEVIAFDIDEWSVENTIHNARLNHVDNLEALLGNANVLSHVSGVFDCVMANINRNILLQDMERYRDVMGVGSTLLLSGFYVKDGMEIAECAGHLGLKLLTSCSDSEWCCLVFESES